MMRPPGYLRYLKHCRLLMIAALLALAAGGCQTGEQINAPPETQFQMPAVGTPIPDGAGITAVSLPDNGSGALLVNGANLQVRVAVSNTIVTIDPHKGFLFVLPAGSYPFYIYGLEPVTQIHVETIQPGKVRYVYLIPPAQ